MTRRPVAPPVVAVVLISPLLLGLGGCDTRDCFTTTDSKNVDCDEVTGVVLKKTKATPNVDEVAPSHQPSLVIDTTYNKPGGNVRVFLKEEFWVTYAVGDSYP